MYVKSKLEVLSWTAISEWIIKLRHNLLHQPALTDVIRISYTIIIRYSKVKKRVWFPSLIL
jgi:hypothetical protein